MFVSEARILANRANALRSTGPKTLEGKERSRANSYKHGMTGDGVVLSEVDAVEVARLSQAFQHEMKPPGEVGRTIVGRMAILAVRMDRCVKHESAAIDEHVKQAIDEVEIPEGVDDDEADRIRELAGARALFDPSHEACLARRYEAAAERGYFRCLTELRQLRRDPVASLVSDSIAQDRAALARLGSFLPAPLPPRPEPPTAVSRPAPAPAKPAPLPSKSTLAAWDPFAPTLADVPIAIGRRR